MCTSFKLNSALRFLRIHCFSLFFVYVSSLIYIPLLQTSVSGVIYECNFLCNILQQELVNPFPQRGDVFFVTHQRGTEPLNFFKKTMLNNLFETKNANSIS